MSSKSNIKPTISPKALKSKLKKEEEEAASPPASISKFNVLLLLLAVGFNFRNQLEPFISPYLLPFQPYLNQASQTIQPHLINYLPISISSKLFPPPKGDQIPEIARIARELRNSWNLAGAEAEVRSANVNAAPVESNQDKTDTVVVVVEGEVGGDKKEEEKEEGTEDKVPARSMEELNEIMQEFTADELTEMLNKAYGK